MIFPEGDWRALHAWRAFAGKHGNDTSFLDWVAKDRPLAEVQGLKDLVNLDRLLAAAGGSGTMAEPEEANCADSSDDDQTRPVVDEGKPVIPQPSPAETLDPYRIELGRSKGIRSEPVSIQRSALTQHLAVLGGTGSGKTTLALTLIEGLLLRGVPAILVDRKGDLTRYADPASMDKLEGPLGPLVRERVEVAL